MDFISLSVNHFVSLTWKWWNFSVHYNMHDTIHCIIIKFYFKHWFSINNGYKVNYLSESCVTALRMSRPLSQVSGYYANKYIWKWLLWRYEHECEFGHKYILHATHRDKTLLQTCCLNRSWYSLDSDKAELQSRYQGIKTKTRRYCLSKIIYNNLDRLHFLKDCINAESCSMRSHLTLLFVASQHAINHHLYSICTLCVK